MTIQEMIDVLEAAKAGKRLQYLENGVWWGSFGSRLRFAKEWRVKPEPREWDMWVDFTNPKRLCAHGIKPDEKIKVREVLE